MNEIIPAEWRVLGNFTHDGLTYSLGAPPPVMSVEQAEGLERAGIMARPRADGSIGPPPVPVPHTPADYLRNNDVQLLRALKEFPPTTQDLAEITRLAASAGRSDVIRAALELAHPPVAGASPRQPDSVGQAIARVRSELQAELKLQTDENEALGNELETVRQQKATAEGHITDLETQLRDLRAENEQLRQAEAARIRHAPPTSIGGGSVTATTGVTLSQKPQ